LSDAPERPATTVAIGEQRRRRRTFIAFWSVVALAVVVGFRAVLVPFILALVIAYVLAPVVRRMTSIRVGKGTLPRWASVLALYVVIVASLALMITLAAPAIASEVRSFARNEVPRLRHDITHRWLPRVRAFSERFGPPRPAMDAADTEDERPETPRDDGNLHVVPRAGGGYDIQIPNDGLTMEHHGNTVRVLTGREARRAASGDEDDVWVRLRSLGAGHTEDILRVGRGIVGGIVGGIFGFFITLMLSAYMLLTSDRIFGFVESLVVPDWRPGFHKLVARVDRGMSGVVRGQLVICAINGVLSAVGFAIAKLPYWPLLALLAAVFSLVPIFGSILSSVPAVAIGLRDGAGTAVFVLVWIIGIHQIEANLLNPKIMGDAAKMHPVLVVFSLLVGEHFFGILGALLAVPAMSLVQSVFLHWREYALNYGADAVR
jgi:predicted PurR-regulated permease PerM